MIELPLKPPEFVNSPQQPKGVCIATFGSFAQAIVRVAWCTFPVLAALKPEALPLLNELLQYKER